jgi:hypothetical protein
MSAAELRKLKALESVQKSEELFRANNARALEMLIRMQERLAGNQVAEITTRKTNG